jgi:hypothetical protein
MTSLVKAPTDIYKDNPGLPGSRILLYKAGDYIREGDVEALGLVPQSARSASPVQAVQDKAKRGPREAPKKARASRDKALTKKEEEEEDG